MTRQIVLDTETTGLSTSDHHRIIEIGCIELVNRQRTYQDFHAYVNPHRTIDAAALAVHGITADFLADKPTFSEIVQHLLAYLEGAELIMHNAAFDLAFLDYELSLLGSQYTPLKEYCSVLDTLVYAREKHAGQRNSLDALCKRYRVDNTNRKLHGALLDAELLAEVYLAMTGGQASLLIEDDFDQERAMPSTVSSAISTAAGAVSDLVVLQPTAEELAAHQAFLCRLHPTIS